MNNSDQIFVARIQQQLGMLAYQLTQFQTLYEMAQQELNQLRAELEKRDGEKTSVQESK